MPPIRPKAPPVATTSGPAATVTKTASATVQTVQKESTVLVKENPENPPPQKTALTVVKNIPNLPAYLEAEVTLEGPAAGLENSASTGLQIPMLLIAQGQGAATQDFHRGTGDAYLSTDPATTIFAPGESIDFVPFFHYMEYILWAPRNQGGGMVDRSKDQKGNLAVLAQQHLARRMKMTPEERQGVEECVAYHVFLILMYNETESGPELVRDTPMALPLSRSKFKSGVRLVQLAKMRAVTLADGKKASVPLYAGKYNLSVVPEQSKRGNFKYQNFAVENAGWVPEADMPFVKAAYERARDEFAELKLAMDREEDPVGEETGSGEKREF